MASPSFSNSFANLGAGDPTATQNASTLSQIGVMPSQNIRSEFYNTSREYGPSMNSNERFMRLRGILKSDLNVPSKARLTSLNEVSEAEIIKSLGEVNQLIIQMPGVLIMEDDESDVAIYDLLFKNIFGLFSFNSKPINTQIGFFLKNLLISISSTSSTAVIELSRKIHDTLFDICNALLRFLQTGTAEKKALPDPISDLSISNSKALEISFSVIQAFLRSAISSHSLAILHDHALFIQVSSFVNSSWTYLKSITDCPQKDLTNIHLIFADICRVALSLSLRPQPFVRPTSQWLFYVYSLAIDGTLNSDIDLTAASLSLDLFNYVIKYGSASLAIENRTFTKIAKSDIAKSSNLITCVRALVRFLGTNDVEAKLQVFEGLSFDNFLHGKVEKLNLALAGHYHPVKQNEFNFAKNFRAPFISQSITSLESLRMYVEVHFVELSNFQKRWLIRKIGLSSCSCDDAFTCEECKKGLSAILQSRRFSLDYTTIFGSIFKWLDVYPHGIISHETITALRRVLTSFDLSLGITAQETFGKWLSRCIRSMNRPLRIATASLLPYLITSEERFQSIFSILADIKSSEGQYVSEAVIHAWGHLGKVVEGERLNLILMCLIEFLSSENTYLTSSSFCQLQAIAKSRGITCLELMSPFWPTISVSVAKRHTSHFQFMENFADLLNIYPNDFFSQTHRYTVPFMVLTRRKVVLEKIAMALGWQIEKLLIHDISKIVAVLLVHESSDIGAFVMQSLIEVHQPFKNVNLQQIINTNRLDIAFEVLKLHDPDDREKSRRISKVFQFLETLLYPKSKKKMARMLPGEYFFDINILGVVAPFAVTIRGTGSTLHFTEKIQCLNGIAKLISCSGSSFSRSVPQICALLQAAMDSQELQLHVMIAWFEMMKIMNETDLERVMNLTFSVIIQKWESMTSDARRQAHDLLKYLFSDKRDHMTRIIQTKGVPYLSGLLPGLADIYENVCSLQRPQFSPMGQLRLLLKRGQDDNIYIVRQAVEEISEFLKKEQDSVKQALASDISHPVISSLFRTLLNIPNKFQNTHSDISNLCTQCIGFLGAVDPLKVDVTDRIPRFIVVHNFDDARESIKFVLHFVEHHLLKGFEASTKPYYQSFLAFGIQEYLKFCNFQLNTITVSPQAELWNKLSDQSKNMLYPLLSSQYKVSRSTPIAEVEYPIFSVNISHSKWLQSFTMDLLGKVKGSNATQIFRLCRKIIKDQDSSLFNFVAPYVTLHVVLSGTALDRENILNEILNVLSTDLGGEHEDNVLLDNLKRSYGIVFSIVDYFNQALRARQDYVAIERKQLERERIKKSSKSSFHVPVEEKDSNVEIVETFLKRIPADLMAKRSFECKSYSRSLMYWEQHLTDTTSANSREKIYSHMMEIYASINDPDSLVGCSTNFSLRSVPNMILQYESTGKWDEALECHDYLAKSSEWDLDISYDRFRCIKDSGRYETLLAGLDSLSLKQSELTNGLQCLGIEAAWLVGDFSKLESWLNPITVGHPIAGAFEVNVGRAIMALKESKSDEIEVYIDKARRSVSKILEAAPVTSLMQTHEAMVRLHGLTDLESIAGLANERQLHTRFSEVPANPGTLSRVLNERLEILGTNYDAKRYLLALRRSAIRATQ